MIPSMEAMLADLEKMNWNAEWEICQHQGDKPTRNLSPVVTRGIVGSVFANLPVKQWYGDGRCCL